MAKITLDLTETNTGWTFVRAELSPTMLTVVVRSDLGKEERFHITDEAWVRALAKRDYSGTNPALDAVVLQKLVDDGHFVGVVTDL